MSVIAEFWSISSEATKQVAQTFHASDVIPYGRKIVQLVLANPGNRNEFVKAFVEGADAPEKCDRWLIEFCMHALRMPEAKLEFERMNREAVAKQDWNRIQPLGHILDAFEDDWEDAHDIYAEYFDN
jgi:hypothetical protein